jgi:CRISPR-associated protein Csm2
MISLWKDREKNIVDPKLYSVTAEKVAKTIARDGQQERNGRKQDKNNKTTQLRRFFDELVRINSQVEHDPEHWEVILPQVHMLIAKAAYAQGRELVTASFVELFRSGIEQIRKPKDLKIFTSFLECFIGFYKIYRVKD